jgi:hypothetical protein
MNFIFIKRETGFEPSSYPTNTEKKGVPSTSDLYEYNTSHIFYKNLKRFFQFQSKWNS